MHVALTNATFRRADADALTMSIAPTSVSNVILSDRCHGTCGDGNGAGGRGRRACELIFDVVCVKDANIFGRIYPIDMMGGIVECRAFRDIEAVCKHSHRIVSPHRVAHIGDVFVLLQFFLFFFR